VDLKKITMPLLNFFGEYDHLVPPEACNQLTGAVGSRDARDVCLETGHIGIYVSSRFQRQFAPRIVQWLKERDREVKGETAPDHEMPDSLREAPLKKPPVRKKPAVRKTEAKRKAPAGTNISPPARVRKSKQSLIQKIAEAI
jgi:polyhydroxyalkanoate synthase